MLCRLRLESCKSCEQRFCSGKAGKIEPCPFRFSSDKLGKNFSLAAACESPVKSCGKLVKSGRFAKSFARSRSEPTELFGKFGALCGEMESWLKFEPVKFSDELAVSPESASVEFKDRAADNDTFCA